MSPNDRFASTVVIASRSSPPSLARDESITRPSPRLALVVGESVGLARLTLERVMRG